MADADKQLDTLYKATKSLSELGYSDFLAQLKRQGYAYRWAEYLFDPSSASPTVQQRTVMHAAENADTDTKKACLDERNAYMLILKLCEGHEVANLLDLQSVPMGHARKALDVIADYFNPNSTAGRQNLIIKFMTSTQATTMQHNYC